MLCAIYKSAKKADTYLYVEKRDDFSRVPEALMDTFGTPLFVMLFNLKGDKALIRAENQQVQKELSEKGFFLQLPPIAEDLLKEHKAALQRKAQDSE